MSAVPGSFGRALVATGLDATEGGPVSCCLRYGRTPLEVSVGNWAHSCELLASLVPSARTAYIESFGGCMLGQLRPPGLLVALSSLEGLFFTQNGIRSVSLSYAQQTDASQDEEAVRALRRLATELMPPDVDWHVVLYTYGGVFPSTERGAQRLLSASARPAVRAGALRLIVKTPAEAHRIPTVEETVHSLETAARAAAAARVELESFESTGEGEHLDSDEVYAQARTFVETTMTLSFDTGRALRMAFARGLLDIPYCLHPDDAGRSRSFIDGAGRLRWSTTGAMPVPPDLTSAGRASMTSDELLEALHYMARRFDSAEASPHND